jgi:hypothetical protein
MTEVNYAIGRVAISLNPILGVIIAICCSVAGAVIANSPMGGIVGLIGGTALALALCGNLAMLSAVADTAGAARSPVVDTRLRQEALPPLTLVSPVAAAGPPSDKKSVGSPGSGASGAGAGGEEEHDTSATESEAELLNAGRFSDYHLTKAKRLFDEGNFKEAIYQAGASLAHDPRNREARELRKRAQSARR